MHERAQGSAEGGGQLAGHRADGPATEILDSEHFLGELDAVCESLMDGLLVADGETTRFERTNLAMCQMLGYRREELLGMSAADIHPVDELPSVVHCFEQCGQNSLCTVRRCPIRRRDGSVFYADVRVSRLVSGGHVRLIVIFRDLTERIDAERALTQDRRLLRNLIAASDRERSAISYEIHDGLTQQLTGAIMQLQCYDSLKVQDPELASAAFQRGMAILNESLREARRLITGVRPPLLDDAGVVPAVENLVQELNNRGGCRIVCHCDVNFGRLDPSLENTIYRIVHEALSNAWRHSCSEQIQVRLVETNEMVEIEVRDWGIGFQPEQCQASCYGLQGIQERAKLLGAKAEIDSQPGHGTSVRIRLPLSQCDPT